MSGPKMFVLDIENAPITASVWSLWNNDVAINQVLDDWYMLTWAGKWVGDDYTYSDSLLRHRDVYDEDPEDDSAILETLLPFLEEADVIIGHNSVKFDVPKILTRMLLQGMDPPMLGQQIDTLKIAKQNFRFSSNKLDFIAQALGLGEKQETGGFDLWKRCVYRVGDAEAWNTMLTYNEQDVVLTEEVYLKLRGWSKQHPNWGLYVDDDSPMCTACGCKEMRNKGFSYTSVGKYRRYQCKSCGKKIRGRQNQMKNKSLLTNAI